MIAACLACTVVTVLLALPRPVGRRWRARLEAPGSRRRRVGTGRRRTLAGVGLAGAVVGVVLVGWGAPAGVVALAGVLVVGTVIRLVGWRVARRAASRRRTEVARGCALLAAQVRVGRVPSEALETAAADFPVFAAASRTQLIGGEVPEALLRQAQAPGCGGLVDLARAWRLGQETGASMAGVLDQVAMSLRRDEALQRTVAAELAGPQASGRLMAILPLAGVGMGYLLGGRPVQFLLDGGLGWTCLLGGAALACAGVLWVDRLAHVAEQA